MSARQAEPTAEVRKTQGGLLEFDAPKDEKRAVEVARKLICEVEDNEPTEDATAVRHAVKEFLQSAKEDPGDAPQCIEDPQDPSEKEEIEISIAIDDVIPADDVDLGGRQPTQLSGILLPTEATDLYLETQKLHQASALTKMVFSLFERDSNFSSSGTASSTASEDGNADDRKMEDDSAVSNAETHPDPQQQPPPK
ncbi:hypothetical protein DIPPA_22937 [Diplonema papillatum]|nr:hypothetical protein DIPPA_22937 [Diplonema papillatum]